MLGRGWHGTIGYGGNWLMLVNKHVRGIWVKERVLGAYVGQIIHDFPLDRRSALLCTAQKPELKICSKLFLGCGYTVLYMVCLFAPVPCGKLPLGSGYC